MILISLLLALGVSELFLRVFPGFARPDKLFLEWNHFGSRPDEIRAQRGEYNRQMIYDEALGFISKGLVELEAQFEAPAAGGEYRVMFLGDSVTGQGIYNHHLENRVRAKWPGRAFRFLHAGVGGWDTFQERTYLATRGARFKPDLVVLQFHMNDFSYTPVVVREVDGTWSAYNLGRWGNAFNHGIWRRSRLAQLVFFRFMQYLPQANFTDPEGAVHAEFARLHELSVKRGFALLVLIFPHFNTENPVDGRRREQVLKICAELKMQCLDLRTLLPFKNLADYQERPGDEAHPNETAGVAAGEAVLPFLLDILEGRAR